jgi:hypothetical protein
MNNEFERTWTNFNAYFEIVLEKMRERTKNTNRGSMYSINIRTKYIENVRQKRYRFGTFTRWLTDVDS